MHDLIQSAGSIGAEYLRDESRSTGHAEYAVFAKNEEDVLNALRFANEKDLPVTVQGGRTGLAGAAVPYGGLILNMSQMDQITGMDLRDGKYILYAQPGVVLLKLRKMIASRKIDTGLFDEASLEIWGKKIVARGGLEPSTPRV